MFVYVFWLHLIILKGIFELKQEIALVLKTFNVI
jgi:ABC-type transport system involved in cytochrome c biogenesis permease subunit